MEDEEVKAALAAEHPYENWLHAGLIYLDDLPDRAPVAEAEAEATDLVAMQRMHGYTEEELRVILAPMARNGAEPIGSMGTDTPVAVLSDRPRLVFDYFSLSLSLSLSFSFISLSFSPRHRNNGHLARHDHRARAEPAQADSGLLSARSCCLTR